MSNTDQFPTGGGLDLFQAAVENCAESDPVIGRQFGSYRILALLAQGGMGRVYRAERIDGTFERNVAIKILPSGLSHEYARRFELERKILASLSHQNIAQLYDAGVSDSGNLYLVMELVDGEPIDVFAAKHSLTLAAKIRLLISLSEALAFAHAKLVVHRDLKPSNVLVSRDGVLKLLDFGIAKILESPSDVTVGALPMTPRFASPEQLLNEPISVASDIYQLGLLFLTLFELRTDLADESRASASERAMRKTSITVESQLATELPVELRAVVNKCLRAEPGERYASATALTSDLRNYLRGFPVTARNPGAWQHTARFLRRNWVASTAFGMLLVSLSVFLFTTLQQQAILEDARVQAELSQHRAEKTTEFLVDLFNASKPSESLGEELSARDILDRGNAQLAAIEGQPELKAVLLETIAAVYRNLGDLDQAIALADEALAIKEDIYQDTPLELASTLALLSRLNKWYGKYDTALAQAQRAYGIQRSILGEIHEDTLETLGSLGYILQGMKRLDEGIAVQQQVLDGMRRVHGENHTSVTTAINNLAVAYLDNGDNAKAAELLDEVMKWNAVQLPAEHPWVAMDLMNYGAALANLGRFEESIAAYEKSLAIRHKVEGDMHPLVPVTLGRYALALEAAGKSAEAMQRMTEAYEVGKQVLTPPQVELAKIFQGLGKLHTLYGDPAFAETLLASAAAQQVELFGSGSVGEMSVQIDLARLRLAQGDAATAVVLLKPIVAVIDQHPDLISARELLAQSSAATTPEN